MKYTYILTFVTLFILFGPELGYTNQSPIHTHFTYMFQHSGIVHLSINSLAFINTFRTMESFINKWTLSASIITIAFASSFVAAYNTPTLGASAMVYAMLGMFFGITAFCDKTKITNKKSYLLFILAVATSLIISYLKHNSNFTLHALSLTIGFFVGTILPLRKNKKEEKNK